MSRYLIRKLLVSILTLFLVVLITFFIFEVIPGDSALSRLGVNADQAQIEALKKELGLDRPMHVRLMETISKTLRGDFGISSRFDEPVLDLIRKRVVISSELLAMTLVLTLALGIPLSVFITKHYGQFRSFLVSLFSQIGMAVPSFWLGILITVFFGLTLRWFTPGRFVSISENFFEGLRILFFASLALAIPRVAVLMRYFSDALLKESKKPFVRTALAKGVSKRNVMNRHIFQNALIPMLTIVGMMVADILGGIIIIEQIFNIPGLGKLLISAIRSHDLPLVQGMVFYMAFLVISVHVILDILYRMIDPRIRKEAEE